MIEYITYTFVGLLAIFAVFLLLWIFSELGALLFKSYINEKDRLSALVEGGGMLAVVIIIILIFIVFSIFIGKSLMGVI